MHYLLGLTEAQREAVEHIEGPLLILAGPGSGKTRVVTHRIAHLLESGVPAHQILALTFTNKAAEEMRNRVQNLVPGESVWLGTFHRFCARLLRKYAPLVGLEENYTIYDVGDSMQALRRIIARLKIDTAHFSPDSIAKGISRAKSNLIGPQQYKPRPGRTQGILIEKIYPAYQSYLAASNAADFDDLLLHMATLLRENAEVRRSLDERYTFILVDEYQDTNLAQYAIARALSIDHPNLAVTGDPDQSIYGWRGANLKNILEFEKDFPNVRVVRLERNYRSTKRILRVASDLIAHNIRRKEKDLYTENGTGQPVRLVTYRTQKDEAEGIAAAMAAEIRAGRRRPGDFAIFYRVNALSRALEFALRNQSIPYQLVNALEFFQRKEIKDVLAYLQLICNPHNEVALLRVINTPTRGIGKTTIERLSAHATRRGITMLEAARETDRIESLKKRSARLVRKFVEMFDRLVEVAAAPIEETLGMVLTETGYQDQWRDSNSEEDIQRLANIEELLTVARGFDEQHPGEGQLEAFLEEACLVSDTDDWETQLDRVTLMTLHSSKGLEFPVVYIIAVEEKLLPHERSRDHPEQLEEERRLMFVGITRAQQELQISLAGYRDFRGQRKITVPSQFLMELPREEMDLRGPAIAGQFEETFAEPDYWQTEWQPPQPDERPAQPQSLSPQALTTAADMANGGPTAQSFSPDIFRHGMVVFHPDHGLGRIVAISGAGDHRKATVDFTATAQRKKFVLKSSPLRPMQNGAQGGH